jgi:3-hydroxyisobutyrate dehydrogenase-like beta-hydroxyacid dehydrogenase
MRVAILGMGEAGRLFARDLVAEGAGVIGYDVRDVDRMPRIDYAPSIADAVAGADLVISLTTAAGSISAATEAMGHLGAGTVYADLNAASPARKIAVSEVLDGVAFADVAVLAPVARDGLRTPVIVSGPGAERYVELLAPFGGPISTVSDVVGDASSRKLIRSIFMKSLATSVLESLAAARIAGCEEWARGQIVGELGNTGDALVERLVTGTRQHSERRLHEMEDTKSYLDELGAFSDMTEASIAWLAGVGAGDRS